MSPNRVSLVVFTYVLILRGEDGRICMSYVGQDYLTSDVQKFCLGLTEALRFYWSVLSNLILNKDDSLTSQPPQSGEMRSLVTLLAASCSHGIHKTHHGQPQTLAIVFAHVQLVLRY